MKETIASFIDKMANGTITVEMTDDHNFPEIQRLRFRYTDESDVYSDKLFKDVCSDLPEKWHISEYEEGGGLLWKSNDLITKFISHSPSNTRGAFALGELKTTKGYTVNVEGGWSSRPGVVQAYTGLELVEVVMCYITHINMSFADAIAYHLGLVIDHSLYSIGSDEIGFEFYKKDVRRCPHCNEPISQREKYECAACGK